MTTEPRTPLHTVELSPSASDVGGQKEKAFPVTAGTLAFLAVCLLLVAGLCRFSFYVLKNHRSAVARDDLVKTYVDVQPYGGRPKNTGYISLNARDRAAPAVFFDARKAKTPAVAAKFSENPKAPPAPVYASAPAEPAPSLRAVPAERLAPVADVPVSVAAVIPSAASEAGDKAVSLDDLLVSGTKILEEAETKIADIVEAEDAFAYDEAKAAAFMTPKEQKKAVPPLPPDVAAPDKAPFTPAVRKKNAERTVWLDVAALRRALKIKEDTSKKTAVAAAAKEKRLKENDALLKMGGAKQTASLKTDVVSDVVPETAPAKKTQTAAVVKDAPFPGTETLNAVGKAADPKVRETVRSKIAQAQKKANDAFSGAEGLWKIAVANGKPKNKLAVKTAEKADEKIVAIKNLAREENAGEQTPKDYMEVRNDLPNGGETVIYRNGRPHKVFNSGDEEAKTALAEAKTGKESSLNWMDRQQAAVWTSMSQSDVPSVWTVSSDEKKHDPEAAKAFKVADVSEPAAKAPKTEEPDVVTSAEVRIVGEEKKPEAKKSPLLLPLGSSAPVSTAAPLPAAAMPASVTPQTAAPAPMTLPALPQPAAAEEEAGETEAEDDSIVGKIKSLFGTSGEAPALPSLGSGTASSLPDLNKKKKASEKKKSSARKQRKDSSSSVREDAFARMESNAKRNDENDLPSELRLTFKPGNAELTSSSVKWIKAFGNRAKKDIQRGIEVRMSNQIRDIQEKRFAIIRSILLGTGMEPTQLFPVMTNRTPHTIVLRAFDIPEEGYEEYTSSGDGVEERIYYRQW